MKPEELHRKHLAALITDDLDEASRLRVFFKGHDRATAVEYLRAATAVCLEHRFGPGAGLGAGPIDYDELRAFMAELRHSCQGTEPPPNYLAVEAVVRSLYGEPHLLEPLEGQQRSQALYLVLGQQTRHSPWLAANPDMVIDRAKLEMTTWLLG